MITWLIALIRCWWGGHDWHLMTASFEFLVCHACGRQRENDEAARERLKDEELERELAGLLDECESTREDASA